VRGRAAGAVRGGGRGRARAHRATVRTRIAAVYGLVFVLLGGILLALVYFLSRADAMAKANELMDRRPRMVPQGNPPSDAGTVSLELAHFASRQVLLWSGAALLVMAVFAVGVGWWITGRVLRPVHSMTSTARRISQENLHERIALDGPRDELKELADTFDALLARLETSFDSQRRFIANASHELRTPLAAQRAALQIGLENPTPEELARVRQSLLDANRRNGQLIDGLLLLAQSERGIETHKTVDLSDVVAEEVASCRAVAAEAGVVVTVEAEPSPAPVPGDRVLLGQLTANLLRNAIAYNQPGGRVDVAVSRGRLTVTNAGPEVPPDTVEALFEPFRRGHGRDRTGAGADRGHGLGLSIVRSIAGAHGGTATATARPGPGGGLRVEVRLP
jgi:signal transduction histidine kinase